MARHLEEAPYLLKILIADYFCLYFLFLLVTSIIDMLFIVASCCCCLLLLSSLIFAVILIILVDLTILKGEVHRKVRAEG